MKHIFFSLIVMIFLFSACSGKNADGTPNVSTGDTSHAKHSSKTDSTADSTKKSGTDVKLSN